MNPQTFINVYLDSNDTNAGEGGLVEFAAADEDRLQIKIAIEHD